MSMQMNTFEFLTKNLGIAPNVLKAVNKAEENVRELFEELD